MRNPILLSKQNIKLYLLVWSAIMVTHISINYLTEKISLYEALVDTIISDGTFAAMALGVWYPIRYLNGETQPTMTFIRHHLGMAASFLIIWATTITCSLQMLIEDPLFHFLFDQSLPWRILTTFLFYCLTVVAYYLYIYYSSFKQTQLAEAELKTLVKETELNLLKSQLNPHFIFNSLNSISSLTISDPACAQEMIVKLSAYIRYALRQNGNQSVTFAEELTNTKLYLEIEKIRFGEKLKLDDQCKEECHNAKVPNMLLQPLLENAIKHGVYESLEPVFIQLDCEMLDQKLVVRIKNDYEPDGRSTNGNGFGLKSVKERLLLLYGDKGSMRIRDEQNKFLVELTIPQ